MNQLAADGMRTVEIDGALLKYMLRLSERRRKTVAITVEPTGEVTVTAPVAASVEQIEGILNRKRGWVRGRVRRALALPLTPGPREWVSGETHWYLGRQYRLKVERGSPAKVRLGGRFFQVSVGDPTASDHVRRLMERWYLDHARAVFTWRLADLVRSTPRLELSGPPPLLVRRLRKRWGSCSPEGRVLMNVDAVKLPLGCVDYLLMHELCHLRVPHHGPEFWRLLSLCMPEWDRWRKRLDEAEI
jgi:predicted metal-dependent hydrolase